MRRARPAAPPVAGHAAAQAWYASFQARLEAEKERTGVANQITPNIVPVFKALTCDAQADFVDALGALMVSMLTIGEPYPAKWNPTEDLVEFAAAAFHPDKE